MERKYGYNGYKCLLDNLKELINDGIIESEGLTSEPLIKPMKRFSSAAIKKALVKLDGGEFNNIDVTTSLNEETPSVHVDGSIWELTDEEAAEKLPKFVSLLLNVFGDFVKSVKASKWGANLLLTDKYLDTIGFVKKRSLSCILDEIYKKHDVGGLKFFWVDAYSKGHRVKVEGVELLSKEDFDLIVDDVNKAFSGHLDRAKQDGEITCIGHRPVGEGLTNHRFFLKDVKGKFNLK